MKKILEGYYLGIEILFYVSSVCAKIRKSAIANENRLNDRDHPHRFLTRKCFFLKLQNAEVSRKHIWEPGLGQRK